MGRQQGRSHRAAERRVLLARTAARAHERRLSAGERRSEASHSTARGETERNSVAGRRSDPPRFAGAQPRPGQDGVRSRVSEHFTPLHRAAVHQNLHTGTVERAAFL